MKSPNRIKKIRMEALEQRCLLAADLVVEIDSYELEVAGDQVSRTVRISNNGDSDAVDAVIQAQLSNQLTDVSWSRSNALAELLHRDEPEPEVLQTIRTSMDFVYRNHRVMGDVNGDGRIDFGVLIENQNSNEEFAIVFGSDGLVNADEISRTPETVASPLGVHISGTDRWRIPRPIGDINGDNIEDFAIRSSVIFGSQDLGKSGAIRPVDRASLGFRVVGESDPWLHPIGDVNDDGFDDVSAGGAVIYGSADIGLNGDVSITKGTLDPNVFQPEQFGWFGTAGDVNGDGVTDFGYGLNLVKGRSGVGNGEETITTLTPTLRDGWGGEANPIDAGDVNGDGMDDLVYVLHGPILDGTATDKGSSYVKTGLNIVFGHPGIFDQETIDVASEGLTLEVGTHYFDRPDPIAEDRNSDGLADIVFSVSGKEFVIFGSSEMTDVSFGFDDIRAFDGFNGFASVDPRQVGRQRGTVTQFDGVDFSFERDWDVSGLGEVLNVFRYESPNAWRAPSERVSSGSGDIAERIDIPAGESVVYEVTGTLKADAESSILITASANESPDLLGTTYDSLGTSNSGESSGPSVVDLRAELSHTRLEVGQKATFEVAIENFGPSVASDVSVESSLLRSLDDASWTLNTERLFPNQPGWSSDLGVDESGFAVEFPDNSDLAYIGSGNTFFAGDLKRLGDINADGIDDVRLGGQVVFGSRTLDERGLEDHATVHFDARPRFLSGISPIGDVNGDGIDDIEVSSWNWVDSSHRYAVVHGRRDLANSEIRLRNSDWNQESLASSSQPGQFISRSGQAVELVQEDGRVIRIGDVNSDGLDDYAATYSGNRDDFLRILFGREAAFDSPVDLHTEMAVEIPRTASRLNLKSQKEDLNGDGIADLVFAFRDRSDSQSSIAVVLGSDTLGESPITFESIPIPRSSQGVSLGDFDNDGWVDLASTEDAVYVYYLGEDLEIRDRQKVTEFFNNSPSDFPALNNIVADINGDGVDDLLIGDPYHGPFVEHGPSGRAYVMFGRNSTKLTGTEALESTFDVAPRERLVLRIDGTVTEATPSVTSELQVNTSRGQIDLNAWDNVVRVKNADAIMATDEILAIDVDGSGQVDFADFLAVSVNFGMKEASALDGDLDGDGEVGFSDFLLLSQWFGARV